MPRVKSFDEQEVLSLAMELFWKKGYAATSIQDLVDHLRLTRASIYNAYTDKETLFKRAFDNYIVTNTKVVIAFLKTQSNTKEGFTKLLEMGIEESVNDKDRKGCFVVNTTTELIPGDPKILEVVSKNKKAFEAIFYDFLKQGEQKGEFKKGKDLKAIASLIFTMYNGLRVVAKINPNKKELMSSVHLLLRVLD